MEEKTTTHTLVTDPDALPGIASTLEAAEAIGTDTETTSLSPRDGRARLLQLATPEQTFVIDLFEVGDISPLKEVLEDGPVKVFHNAKFDYQFLKELHGISVAPIFDTMLAAQVLDGGRQGAAYGLDAVAERYLDEAPDKSEQRGDWWGQISGRQLAYAGGEGAGRRGPGARSGREAPGRSGRRCDWAGKLSGRHLGCAARAAAVLLPLREKLLEALEA